MSRTSFRAIRSARGAAMGRSLNRIAVSVLGLTMGAGVTACYNFNITDPNGPSLAGLTSSPSLISVNAAVTGVFARTRADMPALIWFVGSMGREGVNLSGNNQPDYNEPYFGPLSSSEDGAGVWTTQYAAIRDADIVIDAAPLASATMSKAQEDLAIGVAQAEKALMFMQVIETRGNLGAPVDVDRPASGPVAPFVTEDSVYATILMTLDSSLANLKAGASAGGFSFPLPAGYANVAGTPAGFEQFVYALIAKAYCLRATEATYDASKGGGGKPGAAAGYYTAALTALNSSFIATSGTMFGPTQPAVDFDFSANGNDTQNSLSDPITGPTFFADTFNITDAQKQAGGALDARVTSKIVSITTVEAEPNPHVLGGIPQLPGWLKFSIYLDNGAVNTAAEIPVIKNEELVLLKAEAEIGTGNLVAAVGDLNNVRENAGGLPAYSGPVTQAALISELLYNRRYSLLWEQGVRWIDARRFDLLSTIEPGWVASAFPSFPPPAVPTRMPVPATECEARQLGQVCSPLGT